MSDLVVRLRRVFGGGLGLQAADRIEALEAEVVRLQAREREREAVLSAGRLWLIINAALKRHRLMYTHDEDGDCLDLVDVLTPTGDEDVARGIGEIGYLSESISEAVARALATLAGERDEDG